jgi:hypothetical protein
MPEYSYVVDPNEVTIGDADALNAWASRPDASLDEDENLPLTAACCGVKAFIVFYCDRRKALLLHCSDCHHARYLIPIAKDPDRPEPVLWHALELFETVIAKRPAEHRDDLMGVTCACAGCLEAMTVTYMPLADGGILYLTCPTCDCGAGFRVDYQPKADALLQELAR